MLRLTTAATLITIAFVLAGCDGTHLATRATPLSCFKAAGLIPVTGFTSTNLGTWFASIPGSRRGFVRVSAFDSLSNARSSAGLMAHFLKGQGPYTITGRYLVHSTSRRFVETVASCLRGSE